MRRCSQAAAEADPEAIELVASVADGDTVTLDIGDAADASDRGGLHARYVFTLTLAVVGVLQLCL